MLSVVDFIWLFALHNNSLFQPKYCLISWLICLRTKTCNSFFIFVYLKQMYNCFCYLVTTNVASHMKQISFMFVNTINYSHLPCRYSSVKTSNYILKWTTLSDCTLNCSLNGYFRGESLCTSNVMVFIKWSFFLDLSDKNLWHPAGVWEEKAAILPAELWWPVMERGWHRHSVL